MIRFTYAETDQGQSSDSGVITTLCSLFENGILFSGLIVAAKKAEEMRRKQSGRGQFSVKELEWFSQNAYNCVVNGCMSWDSKHIISMTDSCLKVFLLTVTDKFLMVYPPDMDLETRRAVFLRKLVCWYISCSAFTFTARKEMHVDTRVVSLSCLTIDEILCRCKRARISIPNTHEITR